MFDALSFAEIDGQHAELLPARTVLSLFSTGGGGGGQKGGCNQTQVGAVNVGLNGTQVAALQDILNVIPILGANNSTSNCSG
ncbi:MAG: hypothetical protein JO296_18770 [Pseudonocardiales bacterium]|jgi:aerobic-type carbon monoxide dehydrogenase small subunit (CoxS/CutS family)|nr:hypothetical protein [Pseudonocardiales bacterium]MBV9652163.1 hypothetical protein [Pseudonocardiales bacterium]